MKSKTTKLKKMSLKDIPTKRLIELDSSFRNPNAGGQVSFFTYSIEKATSTNFSVSKEEIREELNSRNLKYGDICDYLNLSAMKV